MQLVYGYFILACVCVHVCAWVHVCDILEVKACL